MDTCNTNKRVDKAKIKEFKTVIGHTVIIFTERNITLATYHYFAISVRGSTAPIDSSHL